MILISTGVEYTEFVQRLKEKFQFTGQVRCKIRDEDDDCMISLADQEDLEMAISASKKAARRERAEFGKLEVSFPHVSIERDYTDMDGRFGLPR